MSVLVCTPDYSQSFFWWNQKSSSNDKSSDLGSGSDEEMEAKLKNIELEQELNGMILSATSLIQSDLENSDAKWKSSGFPKHFQRGTATAEVLGAHLDGSPIPLSFFEWLQYGTRSRLLLSKLKKAQSKSEEICEELDQFDEDDDHNKDILLVQHFVLEQFTPLRRLALQSELFSFDTCKPQKVHYLKWVMAWFIANGIFGFFLYWIFAWGAKNAGKMMDLWGESFGLAIIQDLFVCIPLKIFVLHGLIMKQLRPQLKQVYHTLSNIAASKLQSEKADETQIVQHISGACRAAAQNPELPSSALLGSVEDVDFITCRRSRKSKISFLAVAVIMLLWERPLAKLGWKCLFLQFGQDFKFLTI
jgi:hypothetical protein